MTVGQKIGDAASSEHGSYHQVELSMNRRAQTGSRSYVKKYFLIKTTERPTFHNNLLSPSNPWGPWQMMHAAKNTMRTRSVTEVRDLVFTALLWYIC
ncbi:hypothetical protein BC938DRAFT_483638 [Jimgerdemannia flammicorona]|uniref:Uncharacterized protein n=1 Tax=Jimgerdemannia flammicorona TaxID=994334 RepID=A0A433QBL5_9FUNG|nr:hypothetical protein BC938DRAFT_483638 [Jimgerdemannia flammicorona]